MSIQKINVGGQDVEIEDVSARTSIANHETRITTLENSSGGGGSSGSGSSEIKTCNFTLYDVNNQVREGYEV